MAIFISLGMQMGIRLGSYFNGAGGGGGSHCTVGALAFVYPCQSGHYFNAGF